MKFSDKFLSQAVTQLCLQNEIDHIVISPGSRNAPLAIGFTEDPKFRNFSIVDERCAAFFALGMAQQLGKPVGLVCTSGSALLNYYPAVSEAFYSDIPLIVLSADRPAHLIDVGDGQTIRQENVFANHILYSVNCKEGKDQRDYNVFEIHTALRTAIDNKGPVHVNLPFGEPLYETTETQIGIKLPEPAIKASESTFDIDQSNFDRFLQHWNTTERKMVLVGVLPPNSLEQRFVEALAADESVLVLTETTSNLHHHNFFPAIDQLIAPLDETGFEALQPELLLTFGGMVVSKKIKAFLRAYGPSKHYHIDTKNAMNTFFVLTHHFQADINYFFNLLYTEYKTVKGDYRNYWLNIKNKRLTGHSNYENTIPFSDFKVFSKVLKAIPKNSQLQLANSATVRYTQLFDLEPSLEVFCNRGTSGIDGSTSTAIGAALMSSLPTVFITGDLSFFYDSNGLWNAYIPKNFRIILVNNAGGGIFRILPGDKEADNFSTFFETSHELTARPLAEMFQFEYGMANDEDSLQLALDHFFQSSEGPKILEIFTPAEVNDRILLGYFDFIR